MATFKYPFISKLFYRYSNFIITPLALYFLFLSILFIFNDWRFVFVLIIALIFIVIVNKKFFHSYKFFPFKIVTDDTKIICTDFYNSKKQVTIPFADIDKIEGGMFSGKPTKPIYIYVDNKKIIGITPHLKNHNKLITLILSKVNKIVYKETLSRLEKNTNRRISFASLIKKLKKKPIKK